jgi:transposase-like protein
MTSVQQNPAGLPQPAAEAFAEAPDRFQQRPPSLNTISVSATKRRNSNASIATIITHLQGSCPRCHHFHLRTPIRVSPRNHTSIQCEHCRHKWFGLGGQAATRLSLLSQETLKQDAILEDWEPTTCRDSDGINSIINAVSSAVAVGSPSITSTLSNGRGTKRPRADSGDSRSSRKTVAMALRRPGSSNKAAVSTVVDPYQRRATDPGPSVSSPPKSRDGNAPFRRRRLSDRIQKQVNKVLRKWLKCEVRRVDSVYGPAQEAASPRLLEHHSDPVVSRESLPRPPSPRHFVSERSHNNNDDTHNDNEDDDLTPTNTSAPAPTSWPLTRDLDDADRQRAVRREKTLWAHARRRYTCDCSDKCACRQPATESSRFSLDSGPPRGDISPDIVPGDRIAELASKRDSAQYSPGFGDFQLGHLGSGLGLGMTQLSYEYGGRGRVGGDGGEEHDVLGEEEDEDEDDLLGELQIDSNSLHH